ncbi:hypothetical protein ACUSIJ_15920 [Pseudochelatococcus sp. B33]
MIRPPPSTNWRGVSFSAGSRVIIPGLTLSVAPARGAPEVIMSTAVPEKLYGFRMGIFPHPQSGRPIGYGE